MATKFITVPIEIMHDKNLTPNQKFILAEIHQLTSLEKGCIATNKHFSNLIGISVQGVSNAINDLVKKGYINIDNSETKRNFGRIITIHSSVYSSIHSGVESKENKTVNAKYLSLISEIIDYLNTTTGKNYSSESKGNQKQILARLKEGYELKDFKNVIDIKYFTWKDNEKMSKYLRPETLFGNKFDSYLNEVMSDEDRYVEVNF